MLSPLVNRQVDFDEFKEIGKSKFLQECKNPYFLWQSGFVDLDLASQVEDLTPETFVGSEVSTVSLIREDV